VVVIASDDAVSASAPAGTPNRLPDVPFHRRQFLRPLMSDLSPRLLVFERIGDDGTTTGPGAYVHSKLTIVDDTVAVVGSANSNYRSWTHDSEVMVTIVDPSGPGGIDPKDWQPIRAMRAAIWQQHLRAVADPTMGNPLAAHTFWTDVWAGKSKTTHVRPYQPPTLPSRPKWAWTAPAPVAEKYWTGILDPRA